MDARSLVWLWIAGATPALLCTKCARGRSDGAAHLREFLYAVSRPPRCDECGWGPEEWLEERRRARSEERAFRVVLNAAGRDAFGRPKG